MSSKTAAKRFAQGKRNLDDAIAKLLPTTTVADADGTRAARGGARSDELLLTGIAREVWDGTAVPADPLLPTHRVSATRTSRGAALSPTSRSSPSLDQAVEIANGILPREFTSWDELPPSWHGDRTGPPSAAGSSSSVDPHLTLSLWDDEADAS
jgi:hypothetical protein